MKYIDADTLKAEIERLKAKYRHNGLWTSSYQSELAGIKIEAMNELLSIIDSLPEQKWGEVEIKLLDSIIDDYEKAAKSFCGYDGKIMLLKAIRDGEYDLSNNVM